MYIDDSKVLVVTNKFDEIRKRLDDRYYSGYGRTELCSSASTKHYKVEAVYDAVKDLLKLLSECVMVNEKNK